MYAAGEEAGNLIGLDGAEEPEEEDINTNTERKQKEYGSVLEEPEDDGHDEACSKNSPKREQLWRIAEMFLCEVPANSSDGKLSDAGSYGSTPVRESPDEEAVDEYVAKSDKR